MANIVVGLVIVGILAISVSVYLNEKRKGVKCVGCPMSGNKQSCTCQIKV